MMHSLKIIELRVIFVLQILPVVQIEYSSEETN